MPPIIAFTQAIIARHGMRERVSVRQGNYFHGDFAEGNAPVLPSNALQSEGVKTCQMLLGKVFRAPTPGGQFVIHGAMPYPDRVSPQQPAFFQLQMLLSFPEGDGHPAEGICDWTAQAGFVDLAVTRLPPPAFTPLVTGRKPV